MSGTYSHKGEYRYHFDCEYHLRYGKTLCFSHYIPAKVLEEIILNVPELTREMCYELLDRVVVGGLPKVTGKERTIDIVYKVDIVSVLRHKFR